MAVRPRKNATSNRRHIPVEIVEEILLHLPVKSVLRFSSVSKSWRSVICQPRFIQRYGAVSGREWIFISPFIGDHSVRYSSCSLSYISSDQAIQDATKIMTPLMSSQRILARCDELWCVDVGESLFLWNPSMNTYKKLADPTPIRRGIGISEYYGLGYDCVGDDYKILKLSVHNYVAHTTELYSLRKDVWRNIELFPGKNIEGPGSGVLVSGAFHWVDYIRDMIVYFDLTTEVYGEIVPPTTPSYDSYIALIALRRKLCTYLNNYTIDNFILWVMEDYGVDKPWTKLYEIQPTNGIPHFPSAHYSFETLKPLYLYDNGDILIQLMSLGHDWNIFIHKNGDAIPKEIIVRGNDINISPSYVYVESLVSPAMWPNSKSSS